MLGSAATAFRDGPGITRYHDHFEVMSVQALNGLP